MTASVTILAPGGLPAALEAGLRHAEACGALRPIRTESVRIADGGIDFMVKWIPSLSAKPRKPAAGAVAASPFLPYERDLFVADVSSSHVALLNKFPVLPRHLLIVTREFRPQEALLTPEDFSALCWGLEAIDGLGFYNGGAQAGASQPHKHLQLIPRALDGSPGLPVEAVLARATEAGGISCLPVFTFPHGFVWLPEGGLDAGVLHGLYRRMLERVGIVAVEAEGGPRQSGPYNLLLTRRWMLVVPRAQESVDGISINALGFAGSLFTPRRELLNVIEERGPLQLLSQVSRSPDAAPEL